MKLLVGTLYVEEEQYADCCQAIRQQTHSDYEHLVVRNLPKREAHDVLYGTFMRRASEFALLVKVDADMVIVQPDLFARIEALFREDRELDLLLIAVQDYFTDRLLIGMNVFRNTVRWSLGGDRLFTDMRHIPATVRKTKKDFTELAPAAIHCPAPGAFQAFHYGFHRGMKARMGGANWTVLLDVVLHYQRMPETALAQVILGADTALWKKFGVEHISYTDGTLREYFDAQVACLEERELHAAVARCRWVWFLRKRLSRAMLVRYFQLTSRWRK